MLLLQQKDWRSNTIFASILPTVKNLLKCQVVSCIQKLHEREKFSTSCRIQILY